MINAHTYTKSVYMCDSSLKCNKTQPFSIIESYKKTDRVVMVVVVGGFEGLLPFQHCFGNNESALYISVHLNLSKKIQFLAQ